MIKEKYKKSYFNIPIDLSEEKFLLFNTFTSSMIEIGKDLYNNILNEVEIDNDLKKTLIDLGFIINNDFDELSYIKIKNRQWRHNPFNYSIAIVPNIDCNFNCKYCFEENLKQYMSEDTVINIENFIRKRIANKSINSLSVSWYGGEPLLSKQLIERLSYTFKKVENFDAAIFTNGYLFDEYFIKNLLNFNINLVHITLDGPEEVHNEYRYLKNGKGTYRHIFNTIERISSLYNDKVYINIRVNIDKNNKESIPNLIKDISRINKNNISFIFQKTCKTTTGNGANFTKTISLNELNNLINFYNEVLIQHGFKKPIDFLIKPPEFHNCYVGHDNGFTINYDGSIYKCFGDVNPSKNKVGELTKNGEILYDSKQYFLWFGYDCLDHKCKSCIILPLCMGGCANNKISKSLKNSVFCNQKQAIKRFKENVIATYLINKRSADER